MIVYILIAAYFLFAACVIRDTSKMLGCCGHDKVYPIVV